MFKEVHVDDIETHVENPQVAGLLTQWRSLAAGKALPSYAAFEPSRLPELAPNLAVVEVLGGGDYLYVYYGSAIAAESGVEMLGARVSQWKSEVGAFFCSAYDRAITERRPVYTVHRANHAVHVHLWERLLLPVETHDGSMRVVVFNKPREYKEDLLKAVLEGSLDGIMAVRCVRSEDGQVEDALVLTANRRIANIIGCSVEKLLGRTLLEAIPDLKGSPTWARCVEVLETRQPQDFELPYIRGKSTAWFRVSAVPLGDGLTVSVSDITALKNSYRELASRHAELARANGLLRRQATELRAAEETANQARAEADRAAQKAEVARVRLVDAFEAVPEGLVLFDKEDRYVLWNRSYAELYAESHDSIAVGARFEDVLRAGLAKGQYPEAVGREEAWLANRVARQLAGQSSHEQQLCNGRWVRIEERRTADGGAIGVRVDITELKRREQELREQNARFDAALNNMSQGLCFFDGAQRLIVCNRRYIEMYDLDPERLRPGITLRDIIHLRLEAGSFPAMSTHEYHAWRDSIAASGEPSDTIVELKNGKIFEIRHRTMSDGGWVATHEDITERHNLLQAQRTSQELLRQQKLQLDTALNNMSQGLAMFDPEQRLVVCNRLYAELYGLRPDQVKPGTTIRQLLEYRHARGVFGEVDDFEVFARDWLAQFGKASSRIQQLDDGRVISIVRRPMPDGGLVSTTEDITERLRVERELDRNREFLNLIIDNVPVAIFVKEASDRRYALVNRAAEEFWGLSRTEMIGKTSDEIFPKDAADRMTARDDQLLQTGQPFFDERQIETPHGGIRSIVSKRLLLRDESGKSQYLVAVIEDVTERKRADERIAHMAHHDALTDLPNRAAFTEHLTATLERASAEGLNFAVLSIDLDRFKEVNDLFGHSAGDALLREVSRRLQAAAEGAFLARLGGDEFMLIAADGPQPSTAEALAERLQRAVADEIEIEGHRLRIGLSIGVAIFPNDGADATTILGNADAGLYRAKSQGRGSIRFFEPDMDQRLRERRILQHELQTAMHRGELSLHYQPQRRIGGEITGFEALVRWRHPTRGMVPPGTFVPLAEESGLILSLGEWILREACREAASWPRPLHIAVNLSPIQFRHGDLPRLVHSVLLGTGLAANRLELEITEGVLIDDLSRALSILRRLKALGVRIAMDDFGTGYSSLSNLQSFPFDKIKIDQSFILNLESNHQSAAIVRAVLGLGRGLDLPVVAEGVETEAQLAFLTSEGCKDVQGYLIGRPNDIAEYAGLVGREPNIGAVQMRADSAR